MNTIQLFNTTTKDLVSEIKSAIIPELKKELSAEFQPKEPATYLTRAEVCDLLKIDLSTLHRWTKKNILQASAIGNRIYYERKHIDEVMSRNKI